MNKLSTVIVDNDNVSRELLKQLLKNNCPGVEIIAEADTPESAYIIIESLKPRLVFFLVELTGNETAAYIGSFTHQAFETIFISSTTQFAVTAFKVNAIDFLLKPYNETELKTAIEKVRYKIYGSAFSSDNSIRIQVHRNHRVEQVSSQHIISLEAKSNYTLITTQDGQKLLVSKVLRNLESLLSSSGSFIRIHRSVIINTSYIKDYSKIPPYTVTLANNIPFEISRRKKSEILEILRSR